MNKTEIIEDYKVKYRKYLFSKSIKVTRSDEDSILVTMPYFCTYKRAKEFLLSVFDKVKTFKFEKAPDNNLKELKKSAKNYLPKESKCWLLSMVLNIINLRFVIKKHALEAVLLKTI